jgi:hypothetical protein
VLPTLPSSLSLFESILSSLVLPTFFDEVGTNSEKKKKKQKRTESNQKTVGR